MIFVKFGFNDHCFNTSFVVFLKKYNTEILNKSKISAVDQFLEIIGRNNFVGEHDHGRRSPNYDISKQSPGIGPCFSMVSDMNTMKFLRVGEGSLQVLGYTSEEIIEREASFIFQIVHPDDLNGCMYLIKTAWEFIKSLPLHLKLIHSCNFYHRVVRKDTTVIKVQLQVINLETDFNEDISVTSNVITDISHLGVSDEVKLSIVNSKDNTCFIATAEKPSLIRKPTIISKRESEILKLLAHGLNSREIADRLCISYYTVRTHRKNILRKLGKKNTAELLSYTLNNGMI